LGIDFENVKVEGYRNINELYKQHTQLHACETLFGDWDAEVMILAQDPANFKKLKELSDKNPYKNPYHHDPKIKTNQNLFNLMKSLNQFNLDSYEDPNNENCGLYYANAIWLLKESHDMSGAITDKSNIYKESKKIFEATLQNLPKLKLILTLGYQSFQFLNYYFENQIDSDWHESVVRSKIYNVKTNKKSYSIASIYHTSNRGMIARANLSGLSGKGSCLKGIELTRLDLQNIFS